MISLLPMGAVVVGSGTAYASGCNTVATGSWSNNCTVSEGSDSHMVQAVQIYIDSLEACGQVAPDGDFGRDTKQAVECYQGTVGLSQDGIVGPLTWGSLQGPQLAHVGDHSTFAVLGDHAAAVSQASRMVWISAGVG